MAELGTTILHLILSLCGGFMGAYVGLRVAVTRLEVKVEAHEKRLDKLEAQ